MKTGMKRLEAAEFSAFFEAIHGYAPFFPWQQMLAARTAAGGWPDVIDLPTASGKTACLDVAVFALALQAERATWERTAARRVWFVVDRRIVVDEAFERAMKIAVALRYALLEGEARKKFGKLHEETLGKIHKAESAVVGRVAERLAGISGGRLPLAIGRLRGGASRDLLWSYNPAQPAIITSTVDQVGSRLLFRAYGVGEKSASIHAGLTGHDSLIILDEAHCARPFMETVKRVEAYRGGRWAEEPVVTPFKLVVMSATPPLGREGETRAEVWPGAGEREAALKNETLQRRLQAKKPAELVVVKKTKGEDALMRDAARRALDFVSKGGKQRVAVMVNRVATAKGIARALQELVVGMGDKGARVELLIGRMRPWDRDKHVKKLTPCLRANKPVAPEKRAFILVTTQCLEVGADFSFEALVTECASLDALRQRFGRLNRLGEGDGAVAPGVILIREEDAKGTEPDFIYGKALGATWGWLSAGGKRREIDMGVAALEGLLPKGEDLRALLAPSASAPILLPTYVDLFSQTAPRPVPEPEVGLFLHGLQRNEAEARLVWRRDLIAGKGEDTQGGEKAWEEKELWLGVVAACPPSSLEALPAPLYAIQKWLRDGSGVEESEDGGDVELVGGLVKEPGKEDVREAERLSRWFVIYRGHGEMIVSRKPKEIRPGDTVMVPAGYGFAEALGYKPGTSSVDIFDEVYEQRQGRPCKRLIWGGEVEEAVVGGAEALREALAGVGESIKEYRAGDMDGGTLLQQMKEYSGVRKGVLEGFAEPKNRRFPKYPVKVGMLLEGSGNGAVDFVEDLNSRECDEPENEPDETGETLRGHMKSVEKLSRVFAELCVSPSLARAVAQAAAWHDVGKADERFQTCLALGSRVRGVEALAKSRRDVGRKERKRIATEAGLPEDFRHEFTSVQLVEAKVLPADQGMQRLVLHLIGAHHGHARPFAPVVVDDDAPGVSARVDSEVFTLTPEQRMERPMHRLDSGVGERFWQLTRHYGWWGLAYLEMLVRLADREVSRNANEKE